MKIGMTLSDRRQASINAVLSISRKSRRKMKSEHWYFLFMRPETKDIYEKSILSKYRPGLQLVSDIFRASF